MEVAFSERRPSSTMEVAFSERRPSPAMEVAKRARVDSPVTHEKENDRDVTFSERRPSLTMEVAFSERRPSSTMEVAFSERRPSPAMEVAKRARVDPPVTHEKENDRHVTFSERRPSPTMEVAFSERRPSPAMEVAKRAPKRRRPSPTMEVAFADRRPSSTMEVAFSDRRPSPAMEVAKRAPKRRRVECGFIEKESAREVTFSKRHQGLFRKAAQISALCGVEVAVITYSPHGNPFAFAHPSTPDALINRYLSGTATGPASVEVAVHKKQYEDSIAKLEEVKRETARIAAEAGKRKWWPNEAAAHDMEENELEYYVKALEAMRLAMRLVADRDGDVDRDGESSGSDYYTRLLATDMDISMDMQAAFLAELQYSF